MSPLRSVLLIAGPTASGKTAAALFAARRAGGEIINADATQLYADLAVLSARPTPADMGSVPHHLFGVLDGARSCSAADWAALAHAQIEAVWARGRLPIVVGGTGMYLRTLLDGIAAVPPIAADVRTRVRALSLPALSAALQAADHHAAARLDPNDRQRRARALEVVWSTGQPLAHWQACTTGGLAHRADVGPLVRAVLLPPREVLYARCDRRLAHMLAGGALAEVRALLARNLPPDVPVMKAVGVPELAAALNGTSDLATATALTQLATRHYAKRQYTWLRNQFADWTPIESPDSEGVNQKLAILLLENGLTVK